MRLSRRGFAVAFAAAPLAACAPSGPKPDTAAVAAGKAFLAKNAKAPGVHVTPSGLQYSILQSGPADGPHPLETDHVKVNYEGRLLNGTVFDSSYQRGEPAEFGVGALIPGWTEALQLMRPGDIWMIWTPPELAYGESGKGPIPPASVLAFKLELIAIEPVGSADG